MQHRMKTQKLSKSQIESLLVSVQVGNLATINSDGSPYVTPVHFAYKDNTIYIHGLSKGQKIDNINNNPKVCISMFEMDSLILDEGKRPCKTETNYQSVIINGIAILVDDIDRKRIALQAIIEKYTKSLANKTMPHASVENTAVIEIIIKDITGKYSD